MYECATCGYQTKRKWSIDYHNNRKTPCKPKNVISNVVNVKDNKNKLENVSNNVNVFDANTVKKKDSLSCPICLRRFTTRQAKSQHKKIVKCKPPAGTPESDSQMITRLMEENRLKDDELVALKSGKTDHLATYI